jgi:hypothetical protein
MNHFYNISIIIGILIVVMVYFLYFNQSATISQDDDIYMKHFDIYGDALFEIYGVTSLIKDIYIDINNHDEFYAFFNNIKHMLQHLEGDKVEIKQGKAVFSTTVVQKKFKQTQTYLEVLYPINDEYYIIFDRIVKYMNLSDITGRKHIGSEEKHIKLINDSNVSDANKDILLYLSKNKLIMEFSKSLGYTFLLKRFISKYDNFDIAFEVIKKYNYLFMTKTGEGIFIWKNINGFSFENNNDNYVFQTDDWIYFYNSVVDKYKSFIGKTTVEGDLVLKSICEKAKAKCDLTDVISNIVETLIHGKSIVKYTWFNNIFMLSDKKLSIVFKYKNYFYGSGFNYSL